MSDAALPIALQALGLGTNVRGTMNDIISRLPIRGYRDMEELLAREGFRPYPRMGSYASLSPTGLPTTLQAGNGNSLSNVASLLSANYSAFVRSVTFCASVDFVGALTVGATSLAGFSGQLDQRIVRFRAKANEPLVIPIHDWMRGWRGDTIALSCRMAGASSCDLDVVADATVILGGDENFSATKAVLWIGDSITNGAPGTLDAWYPQMLMQALRDGGNNCRLVNQSLSSSTSADHEALRKWGRYNLPDVGLVVYSVGMNDAGASIASSAFMDNLSAMWGHIQDQHPAAHMLILGPTPAENNTVEGYLAQYRAAEAAMVDADTTGRLHYIDLGSTFDRTAGTSVYAASDTPGSRVHPNAATHPVIGAAIVAALASHPVVFA